MRRGDFFIGIGLLLFALLYLQQSFLIMRGFASDKLGPAFFPRLLGVVLATLAVTLIVRALFGRSDPTPPPAIRGGLLAAVVAVLVAYSLIMPWLGFLITTPLLLIAIIWMMGMRRWGSMIGTAVGLTLVLYLVFVRALHVLLPLGPVR